MEFSKEENALLKAVGTILINLREKAGFDKPTPFAKSITMDPGHYVRYERGENMTLISLMRLLSHHNLSLLKFFIIVFKQLNTKNKH